LFIFPQDHTIVISMLSVQCPVLGQHSS